MRRIVIHVLLLSLAYQGIAQENSKISGFSFSHQPFYMIKNMLKTDFDFSLGSGHWITLSPMFAARENFYESDYYYYNDYYEDDFNELLGYGLTIGHRMYGKPIEMPRGFYFMYQAGWNHFNLEYRDRTWGDVQFDGYDAITFDHFDMSTVVDKLGLDILVGYQFVIKDALLLDFYFGGGIRYSIKEFTGNQQREYNYSFTDYGYTGLLPQGGIRLGVVL